MQEQTQRRGIEVVHPDVTHADPGVVTEADDEQEAEEADEAVGHEGLPGFARGHGTTEMRRRT
jgi:hypothetical protein